MPFGDYISFDDCVSKNQDKNDPAAYCAAIKQKTEAIRHMDFQRIHTEFQTYYGDPANADREYYDWLSAMSLDETIEYGQARESFKWAKNMLSFLKEDADNKYYQILVGFPTKSMNGNVYKERDLIAAALTLKGCSPSLNHKDEFWFSPENPLNHWGHLTVVDAKYEDGAVEAILKVPKSAVCPICNGKNMTELIDRRKIVNVSLEGECIGGCNLEGECEGFRFNEKGFTLLTTDVLPGIPLARIKPLEAYLPFSQSSTYRGKKIILKIKETDNMKLKIVPKKKKEEAMTPEEITAKIQSLIDKRAELEQTHTKDSDAYWAEYDLITIEINALENALSALVTVDALPVEAKQKLEQLRKWKEENDKQCGEGKHWDETEDKCVPNTTKEASDSIPKTSVYTAVARPSADQKGNLQNVSQQTKVEMGSDPAKAKPEGIWTVRIADPATAYPKEAIGDPITVKKKDQPEPITPETPMPKPDSHVGPSTTPKPSPDLKSSELPAGTTPAPEPALGPDMPAKTPTQPEAPQVPADDKPPYKAVSFPSDEKEPLNEQEQDCGDDEHWDAEQGMCIPNSDASERVRRIKAEYAAERARNDLRYVEAVWIEKYTKLDSQNQKLRTISTKQNAVIQELRIGKHEAEQRIDVFRDKHAKELQEAKLDLEDYKGRYGSATRESSKFSQLVEQLRTENLEIKQKYHGALSTNLKLTRDVTKANEEYLQLAKEKEQLQEKLSRARVLAKKTLKIKV